MLHHRLAKSTRAVLVRTCGRQAPHASECTYSDYIYVDSKHNVSACTYSDYIHVYSEHNTHSFSLVLSAITPHNSLLQAVGFFFIFPVYGCKHPFRPTWRLLNVDYSHVIYFLVLLLKGRSLNECTSIIKWNTKNKRKQNKRLNKWYLFSAAVFRLQGRKEEYFQNNQKYYQQKQYLRL